MLSPLFASPHGAQSAPRYVSLPPAPLTIRRHEQEAIQTARHSPRGRRLGAAAETAFAQWLDASEVAGLYLDQSKLTMPKPAGQGRGAALFTEARPGGNAQVTACWWVMRSEWEESLVT